MTALEAITMQSAATQMSLAQSVLRASAQADQQIANILEQSTTSVPVSRGRGDVVNFSA